MNQSPNLTNFEADTSAEEPFVYQRDFRDLLEYTTQIIEKRYDLYHWCEQKIASLATIDGVLLASLFLLVGSIPGQGQKYLVLSDQVIIDLRDLAILALLEALICLLISISVCLWHIIPLMDSKVGNQTNPRSVIGIERFKTAHDYHQAILQLDLDTMLRYNAYQIKGMNKNIWRDQKAIRYGVVASVLSLAGLSSAVAFVILV